MCEPRAGWTSTVVARHSLKIKTKMRTHQDTGDGPHQVSHRGFVVAALRPRRSGR